MDVCNCLESALSSRSPSKLLFVLQTTTTEKKTLKKNSDSLKVHARFCNIANVLLLYGRFMYVYFPPNEILILYNLFTYKFVLVFHINLINTIIRLY